MTTTAMKTQGQELTDTLRRYFNIDTRTRIRRNGLNLHTRMVEELEANAWYPGCNSEATTEAFLPGFAVALAYRKHVEGHRVDVQLARQIREMSPWRFAALLGRMVDAGVTNCGEGERFFADMAREVIR